jgi:hypothetical protein
MPVSGGTGVLPLKREDGTWGGNQASVLCPEQRLVPGKMTC